MRLIDADALQERFKIIFGKPMLEVEVAPTVNALPISEGATNGGMMKKMFPKMRAMPDDEGMVDIRDLDEDRYCACLLEDWWNAPYEGGKE